LNELLDFIEFPLLLLLFFLLTFVHSSFLWSVFPPPVVATAHAQTISAFAMEDGLELYATSTLIARVHGTKTQRHVFAQTVSAAPIATSGIVPLVAVATELVVLTQVCAVASLASRG
jgi:hypothetical protein